MWFDESGFACREDDCGTGRGEEVVGACAVPPSADAGEKEDGNANEIGDAHGLSMCGGA